MPISEKIISEIDAIDADEKLKELMKDILSLEDDGARRWTKQYESKINEYLEIKGEEENN